MGFEYKVVPAPTRGKKAKGVKTPADRFAKALSEVMNDLAADGWEYLRTDTLPSEERQGLTGRTTVFQNMLVFRRSTDASLTEAVENPQDSAGADLSVDVTDIADTHAPKLPSAAAANDVPDGAKAIKADGEKRDVAAE